MNKVKNYCCSSRNNQDPCDLLLQKWMVNRIFREIFFAGRYTMQECHFFFKDLISSELLFKREQVKSLPFMKSMELFLMNSMRPGSYPSLHRFHRH